MSKNPQGSMERTPYDFLLECSSSSKTTQPLSSQKSKSISVSSNPFTVLGTLPSQSKTPANYKNALKPDTIPGFGKLPEINNRKIQYISKNTVIHVAEFEDEWAKYPSLDEYLSRIFPPFLKDDDPFNFLDRKYQVLNEFYFIPQNLFQSRMWYKSILKVTKSAIISHTPNKRNTHWIDFSKIKILKVVSLSDWNQEPWEPKVFSLKNGQKSQFSYQDYMKAWYNVLYFRPSSHSWFILFDQNCPKIYPKWFQSWWIYFGAGEEILTSRVSEEKSKIMAQLAQCSDPEVFAVLAQKAASMAKAESSRGSVVASDVGSDLEPNFEDDNEDDCLRIGVDFFEN
ncbi:Uncharacterized protein Adt_19569 [Abeliophyllum distichum]|uniref:Uncharacterized protein n=1 Tax=Abeliophyllum distichum TaxID=126358 RepID=A0ABD1SVF6_9LAMI